MLNPSIIFRQPGLAASLTLHALALVCAIAFERAGVLPEVSQQAISVEIVTLSQVVGKALDPLVLATPDFRAPSETAETQEEARPDMVHATEMLTGKAFADPRNVEARKMLSTLDTGTLREQLCDIEAMEQIEANQPLWHPQAILAYAFADTRVVDDVMTADGAAVLIGTEWRKLRFNCTLAPDLSAVIALDFSVGDVITTAEADRYGLAVEAGE